ncbi:UNVERIFIED_CONTAM: hypothetical protein HDU68_010095 [Siphonaria sp. JEL0065]|nr:hypothetical protein HDU68_010095 [Siphonaria sp. JEL0065]
MASCCAVPINYHLTDAEVVAELSTLGACAVILSNPKEDLMELLDQSDIAVLILTPNEDTCGYFTLHQYGHEGEMQSNRFDFGANRNRSSNRESKLGRGNSHHAGPDDFAMILRTSGTSGNKKTVPYTLKTLVVGAICVAKSWGLRRGVDINLNMMPLYHVGGIVRNLLAPILSRSTVIITAGFDATAFWDILQTQSPTWYYAVPTMHMAILDQGVTLIKKGNRSANGRNATGLDTSIRMIANAGGGLPHSLALRLREMFQGSTVLPSYGMTECMPIATPPLTYNLEKPGCSGVAVGPEIAIKDDNGKSLPANKFGRIAVRGPPVFQGYEGNPKATKESFTKDGFFDTGDMGYLDEDGYLFITGRSKEVINRGGEIISPVEVEDAVLRHPKVQTAIAFSVPHDVLQETIGIVVVPKEGKSRVGLLELQKFVATILHPSKWPQLIVYMNDLPKNQTGKPLRIKLSERMKIEEIDDSMSAIERSYEATCPPLGTALTVPIPAQKVTHLKPRILHKIMTSLFKDAKLFVVQHSGQVVVFVEHSLLTDETIRKHLANRVHDYEIPQHIMLMRKLPRTPTGDLDTKTCIDLFIASNQETLNNVEEFVVSTFQNVLGLNTAPKSTDDFFEIGGNSLTAGKVIALIRGEFGVKLSPMTLFKCRTARAISATIESEKETQKAGNSTLKRNEKAAYKAQPPKSRSPTSFIALYIQSLSLFVLHPLPIIAYWLLFAHFITWLTIVPFFGIANSARGDVWSSFAMLVHLISSGVCAGIVTSLVFPFVGIAAKWIIIGRYREGNYPFWGQYYLRWWLVDQLLLLFGGGFFHLSDQLYVLYLRMMGAEIGWNVKIDSKSTIREFDLVHVYPNTSIAESIVRGFAVDAGVMVLKSIRIDRGCVVNQQSVIAPGAILPSRTILPPRSSSHELEDSSPKHRIFAYTGGPSPNILTLFLIGYPIVGLVHLFSLIPWLACMYWLVQFPFFSNPDDISFANVSTFGQFLLHQAQLYRIGIHVLAVACRASLGPFFRLAATLFVKKVIIGLFQAGQKTNSQWQSLRHWIMKRLLGSGELCGTYSLLGRHYSAISAIYRALGAKIGKRVYWPGTAMPFYEFDLLEIGDDVVFGSRSKFVFSDAVETRPIVIGSGAMIADRCVILPGVVVGKNAMIGSGSLLYKNGKFAPGSTWIGSKGGNAMLWEEGDRAAALRAPTLKPFGKAFFMRDASYRVYSQFSIILTNILFTMFTRVCWNAVPLVGVIVSGFYFDRITSPPESKTMADVIGHAMFIGGAYGAYYVISAIALCVGIGAKWIIMGRRLPGSHDWDKSSYCQRWQLYITLQSMQSGLLSTIRGSHFLVMYFRALGCKIGERVCLCELLLEN